MGIRCEIASIFVKVFLHFMAYLLIFWPCNAQFAEQLAILVLEQGHRVCSWQSSHSPCHKASTRSDVQSAIRPLKFVASSENVRGEAFSRAARLDAQPVDRLVQQPSTRRNSARSSNRFGFPGSLR
jgi:hypothetical protein